MYTNSTFFGKKAKQNTKTPFFWQYCIILSAEALLKPQGGNCAVLPKLKAQNIPRKSAIAAPAGDVSALFLQNVESSAFFIF